MHKCIPALEPKVVKLWTRCRDPRKCDAMTYQQDSDLAQKYKYLSIEKISS